MVLNIPDEDRRKAERRRLIRKGALMRRPLVGPLEASVILTYRCNYRCVFCALESEAPAKKADISPDALERLISDLAELNTEQVSFTGGGEPMLYRDIDRFIELTRKHGMACSICTNGSRLDEDRIRRYAEIGVHLSISLNAADADTYTVIHPRTKPEDFHRITRLLGEFVSLAEKLGTQAHSFVSLNFVIHSNNYHQIMEMHRLAREIGASQVQFRLIQPREAHRHLFLDEDQLAQAREQVRAVEKEAAGDARYAVQVMEILRSSEAGIPSCNVEANLFCEPSPGGERSGDSVPCLEGYIATYIDSDGIVFPCCMRSVSISNHYMGNINEQSFKEIWHGESYQKFRTESFLVSVDSHDPRENSCAYCPKATLFQVMVDEWSAGNYLYYYDAALKDALSRPIPRVLPPRAYAVKFISHTLPDQAVAGSVVEARVKFKNVSDYTWPALGEPLGQAVGIGYHLRDRWSRMISFDNNPRSYLERDLEPQGEAELTVKVKLPEKPGRYIVEFALLQEKCAWFEQLGAETLKVPIKVKRA